MRFEAGIELREYRWGHLLAALPLGFLLRLYVWLIYPTLRFKSNAAGRVIPERSILVTPHSDYYPMLLVTRILRRALSAPLQWLGYHGFYSYVPYLWFMGETSQVFRYRFQFPKKPFHQLLDYLTQHDHLPYGQYADTGGPYGRVREALGVLMQRTQRPVVFFRVQCSSRLILGSHQFPLPFGTVELRFSDPQFPAAYAVLSVEQQREMLQAVMDQT